MNQSPSLPTTSAFTAKRPNYYGTLTVGVIPIFLVGVFYYGPVLLGKKGMRGGSGDAAFYSVQSWRVGKLLGGRWWRQTEPLGPPQDYPPDTTRLPHVFEGVDTMLLSAVTCSLLPAVPDLSHGTEYEVSHPTSEFPTDQSGGILHGGLASPIVNFNILSATVLLLNGWVAGWMVQRYTGSSWWAVLAQVLITLNWPTAFQFNTHLNWYKHYWVLAVVATAFGFWERPSLRRAALFGLCLGLLVQGSWYLSYLLLLAMLLFLAGLVARGDAGWKHVQGLVLAGIVTGGIGGVLTLPYWAQRHGAQEQFKKRDLRDLLWFSSEPSHYLLPLWSRTGQLYHGARVRYSELASDKEIWNYPGALVLITLAGYGVWVLRRADRMRGHYDRTSTRDLSADDVSAGPVCRADVRRMDYLAVLSALLVFISLAGGISILLYKFVPMFRVYGRAGVMAVGIWAVLVPLLLHRFSSVLPTLIGRRALAAACIALAVVDGSMVTPVPLIARWQHQAAVTLPEWDDQWNLPGWIGWLARQPSDTRAAIIPLIPEDYTQSYWWFFHRRPVLNTCDIRFCQKEAIRAGGPKDQAISRELLDVLRVHGYTLLIVQQNLWRDYPWLDQTEDVTKIEDGGDWRVYRLSESHGTRERPRHREE